MLDRCWPCASARAQGSHWGRWRAEDWCRREMAFPLRFQASSCNFLFLCSLCKYWIIYYHGRHFCNFQRPPRSASSFESSQMRKNRADTRGKKCARTPKNVRVVFPDVLCKNSEIKRAARILRSAMTNQAACFRASQELCGVICGHVTRPYVCIMCVCECCARCQRLMQWIFRAGVSTLESLCRD